MRERENEKENAQEERGVAEGGVSCSWVQISQTSNWNIIRHVRGFADPLITSNKGPALPEARPGA